MKHYLFHIDYTDESDEEQETSILVGATNVADAIHIIKHEFNQDGLRLINAKCEAILTDEQAENSGLDEL